MSHAIEYPRGTSVQLRSIWIALFGILLVGSSGAIAQEVSVEFDEAVDFTRFKTFNVREGHLNSRAPALNSELTKKRIQSEIEKALTNKGLTQSVDAPDLEVVFHFGSVRSMETKTVAVGIQKRGRRVVNVPQAEGTMMIDLHDRITKALVWRGTSVDDEANPVKLADRLDNMVKKAVGKYPPKK